MQNQEEIVRFAIAGAGHVATRLIAAFAEKGYKPMWLLSKSDKGKKLSEKYGVSLIQNPKDADSPDVWILCVKDDILTENYFRQFPENVLLCHTAGSVSISVFGRKENAGVFYPLQTLSSDKEIDFSTIPVCIEALTAKDLHILTTLASIISRNVRQLDSIQRKNTHLAAVFVSNFVNYCYRIGYKILEDHQVDFSILEPLIQETAEKIKHLSPEKAQTGPAQRGDLSIMNEHINLLQPYPDFQNIYKIISNAIEHDK